MTKTSIHQNSSIPSRAPTPWVALKTVWGGLILILLIALMAVLVIKNKRFIQESWYKARDFISETIHPTTNDYVRPVPYPQPFPPAPTSQSVKVVSWNLYNFGFSKDDDQLKFISELIKGYDIVALQEISTKINGPRTVAKLNEELNRRGDKWDYLISDPTSGEGAERYAFLYKTKHIKLEGRGWLLKDLSLHNKIAREPFLARFKVNGKSLLIANFHAVPTTKNPAAEVALLEALPTLYPKDRILLSGDFNLSEKNAAFEGLKSKGMSPVLKNQKTSLKTKLDANGGYLSAEYDNVFYKTATLQLVKSGVIDFVPKFESLTEARKISDHLPVWCEISWR